VGTPRTTIRLGTSALALSLDGRINQMKGLGERGISFSSDSCDVVLQEFPRRPDQVKDVLDAVAEWLDEVGHPT
jgi:hypothetical protein